MKVVIVDDEHLARGRLARMLEDLKQIELVGEAENGIRAIELCNSQVPDVVLMDIRMPGMDGLEAARHIVEMEEPPAVIFCTAYEEHAIEAFDVQAVGYLLKPVRREDLSKALTSARRTNRMQLSALAEQDEQHRTHISARTRRGIELVPVTEVRYFQADQKYVTVRHADGELLIDETLRELEKEFAGIFIRVHRNAIVAANFIEGMDRNEDGQYEIRFRGIDEQIAISRRHVAGVRKILKNL